MGVRNRHTEGNCPYFVTTVTKGRQPIFQHEELAALLCDVIRYCRTRYGFLVLSYAVMPDHFHTIIVPRPPDTISQVMRYIKGRFSRLYNAHREVDGAVWQARFHDAAVRSERELWARIEYIEQNPVEAGLADEAKHYRFSSAFSDDRTDVERYFSGSWLSDE